MARIAVIVMMVGTLLVGLVAAAAVTAGIAFMAAPLDRAAALDARTYDVVHGELRKQDVWRDTEWRVAGVDAGPMTSGRDDVLEKRIGREVIGLVHREELLALELPDGDRVVRSEVGWAPVWAMAFFVLAALVVAGGALGLLVGAVSRRLPLWARGALATAPFVLAGVVIGHLRSGEMVKADIAVVAPTVALVMIGFTSGPRWYAAARALASQDPFASPER